LRKISFRDGHPRRHVDAGRRQDPFGERVLPASASTSSRYRPFFVRYTERVKLAADRLDDAVDLGVRARAGEVHRPRGKDVAERVELTCDSQKCDDIRVLRGRRAAVERVPEIVAVVLEDRGMLPERGFRSAHEIEDVVHALRLRLCIANQRGAQTPVVRARAFGEVDETRKCWWLDIGRHCPQATEPVAAFETTPGRSCGVDIAPDPSHR
jgi:hypothetical protein